MKTKFVKSKRIRLAYVILITLVAVAVFRNRLARTAMIGLAHRIADVELDVRSVRIGWRSIEIHGIRVFEPEIPEAIQIETAYLRTVITPICGLRNGIWARNLLIQQPTLHLRFDRDGALISKFPSGNKKSATPDVIPIQDLTVQDAAIVIHQHGRRSFATAGMKLQGKLGDSICMRGEVPSFLGGIIQLQSELNVSELSGRTKVTIDGVAPDTDQMAALPLLPDSIQQLGLSGSMSGSVVIDHPANQLDFRQHAMKIVAGLKRVNSTKFGAIAETVDVTATNHQGLLKLTATGSPLAGRADVELVADLNQVPMTADASLSLQNCDLNGIANVIAPDAKLMTKAGVVATMWANYDGSRLSFDGKLDAAASSTSVADVPLDDVVVTVTGKGSVNVTNPRSATGSIEGSIVSKGIGLDDVGRRLQLPESTGQVAVNADFRVPINRLLEPEAYVLRADAQTSNVAVAEMSLKDTVARLRIENAKASVRIVDAVISDRQQNQVARIQGRLYADLVSDGIVTADVDIAMSPSDSFAEILELSNAEFAGDVWTKAIAECQIEHVAKPEAWAASISMRSNGLVFAGETIGDFESSAHLDEGELSIPSFPIRWRNSELIIAGNGRISNDLTLDGSVKQGSIQIEDIVRLASRFSTQNLPAGGIAQFEGDVQFKIPDLDVARATFRGAGKGQIDNLRFAKTKIGSVNLTWIADPTGLTASSTSEDLLGGDYSVSAIAQDLDWTKTTIEGKFRGIQASRLASLSESWIPVTGVLDGGLQVTDIGSLETANGRAWIESRGVKIQHLPVEVSAATISIDSGNVIVNSEGMVGRGKYIAHASSQLRWLADFAQSSQPPLAKIPIVAKAELIDFPVNRLTEVFRLPRELETLHGNLSATLVRTARMKDADKLCDVTGTLADVRLNQVSLSDRIVLDLAVHPDRIALERVDGRFADGRLSGRAEIRMTPRLAGSFDFSARRVNLRRVSAAAIRNQTISGSGTVSVRGKIGQVVGGHAEVSCRHGVFAGVSVREAKFPIEWSYSQPSRIARWNCRAGSVSVGGGNVRVASAGTYANSLSMVTSARIERVDSAKLMAGKSLGAGTISGNVTANAKRARSVKQIAGRFDLELANPTTLEMPILNQLPSIVSLSPPRPGRDKDGGHVEGRIGGGLVHIDELAVAQSNVQVLMDGSTTLDGRLNFDVTVSTESNGPADQILSLTDSPLMLAAPAPIALIAKANDLMKDRVVHVHVGGIATRPTLRLQPGKQLSQDAVRFFLKNSFGSQAADFASQRTRSSRR